MAVSGTPWYRMDNASVMYSAIQREEYSAIYRFSAWLREEVRPDALQRAVDRAMPRFPGFAVRIRRGFFWYYFEPNRANGPFVQPDSADPCRPVRFGEDNGWLVRLLYYGHRVSLEVFHAVADGAGALVFFRAVLAEYLRQTGEDVPVDCAVDLDAPPVAEEWEDAYLRYSSRVSRRMPGVKRAYQDLGTPEPFYTFHVTMGFVPIAQLKARAKALGGTITEYLAAVLLHLLLEKQRRETPRRQKPVSLGIPVNLRQYFPTETLRNFIMTVPVFADPALGEYSLAELVNLVRCQLRLHATPQELQAVLTRGVRLQYNPVLKVIPRVVKNVIMLRSYPRSGVRPFTATFTNPGYFALPEPMACHVEHMEVVLGQAAVPRPHVSAIGYGDTMEITVSGVQRERDLEREFFRFLVRDGLHVRVESNRR